MSVPAGVGAISVDLPAQLLDDLDRLAGRRRLDRQQLIEQAIHQLLISEDAPEVPRYARRLGPLA